MCSQSDRCSFACPYHYFLQLVHPQGHGLPCRFDIDSMRLKIHPNEPSIIVDRDLAAGSDMAVFQSARRIGAVSVVRAQTSPGIFHETDLAFP